MNDLIEKALKLDAARWQRAAIDCIIDASRDRGERPQEIPSSLLIRRLAEQMCDWYSEPFSPPPKCNTLDRLILDALKGFTVPGNKDGWKAWAEGFLDGAFESTELINYEAELAAA